MSAWPRPTTADIGLRAFASKPNRLFTETTIGMQEILLSESARTTINSHIRHASQWQITAPYDGHIKQWDLLLVQWLEEVLYRAEVKQQWLFFLQSLAGVPTSSSLKIWIILRESYGTAREVFKCLLLSEAGSVSI